MTKTKNGLPTPDTRRPTPDAGFTLMEVLVVLTIFSTISVAVTDLFLISSKAERRTGAEETLLADAREATEYVVRLVRSGSVDYGWYAANGGLTVPTETLALLDAGGEHYRFYKSSDPALCKGSGLPCLIVDDEGVTAPLTPAGLTVEDAKFFVAPSVDPFNFDAVQGKFLADVQPTVTLDLSLLPGGQANQRLSLQTTVTTRQYQR